MYTITTEVAGLMNMDMSTPYGNISFEAGVAEDVTEEQAMFFKGNPHYAIQNGDQADVKGDEPSTAWSVKQIRKYAADNEIPLGNFKSKAQMLEAIDAATKDSEEEEVEEDTAPEAGEEDASSNEPDDLED